MKTRHGFVSNSSSSSFILGFKKKPKCVCQVYQALFPKEGACVTDGYDESISGYDVASTVFNDLLKAKPIRTLKQFTAEVRSGYFEGYPESDYSGENPYHKFEREFRKIHDKWPSECATTHPKEYEKWVKLRDEFWAERTRRIDEAAVAYAKNEWTRFRGCKFIVSLSYGDEDGSFGSIMEHGNAWNHITHLRISHH